MPLPGSDVTLRLAVRAEAVEIAALSRGEVEYGLPWSWTPPRVEAAILRPDTNVVVARGATRLAGFGIMRYAPSEAHLELFAVDPGHRRQGLGRLMLAWLEKPAVLGGLAAIWLEVRAGNRGALAFYESVGYRRVAEIPGYYQGRETAVRMGRDLA